jgi:hypothetical protein
MARNVAAFNLLARVGQLFRGQPGAALYFPRGPAHERGGAHRKHRTGAVARRGGSPRLRRGLVLVANSNSNVLMMESAQDWYGQDAACFADLTPNRRILLQRQVCPDLVVVFLIRKEPVAKISLSR